MRTDLVRDLSGQSTRSPCPSHAMIAAPRPHVLAAVRDEEWRSHVQAQLTSWTALTFVDDAEAVADIAGVLLPDVVLWHLTNMAEGDDPSARAVGRTRQVSPQTTIVAYCDVSRAVAPVLLAAGRAGVDHVLIRGLDDLLRGVRGILDTARGDVFIRDTLARLAVPTGPAMLAFAHCLRRVCHGPISVQRVVAELNVNRKTLRNWLRDADLPAPEELIGWSRILNVVRLLDDPRRSVAVIARAVGFSSESDLRRMLSRYVGYTPTQVRARGGVSVAIAALRTRIDARRLDRRVNVPHPSTGMPQ